MIRPNGEMEAWGRACGSGVLADTGMVAMEMPSTTESSRTVAATAYYARCERKISQNAGRRNGGNGGKELARVRGSWLTEDLFCGAGLHEISGAHYRDVRGDLGDDR